MKTHATVTLTLDKFVHGGQAIGTLETGQKVLVWGGLPGETVEAVVYKKKSSYLEAIAIKVIKQSSDRIEPKEPESYLSTSPWQIMKFSAENKYKKDILAEVFDREGIKLPKFEFKSDTSEYGYRNKMEFGFWGDEAGVSLAHFKRGSHGKIAVKGSALASTAINKASGDLISKISQLEVRAGDLKALIIRSSHKEQVVAGLFVKTKTFPKLELSQSLKGLAVYFSDPKSPASLVTKTIYTIGDITLSEDFGRHIIYDVNSFFQVNVPVFKLALSDIKTETENTNDSVIDMYSGVGTIGLGLNIKNLTLVESDNTNIEYLNKNAGQTSARILHSESEKALDVIETKSTVIIDPPRAGLHPKLINHFTDAKPKKIIYLSCNPSTQARDVKILMDAGYSLKKSVGYNFFPRTPHIENLVVLDYKG